MSSERVTVTLAADLLEAIDRVERNRSRFIAQAVRQELARRRHQALLQSTPTAESGLLVLAADAAAVALDLPNLDPRSR